MATTAKIENAVRNLVSRFFDRSGEEVVTGEILSEVAYGKQYNAFTGEERQYIALETVNRVEGWEAVDYAKELIEEDGVYKKKFHIFLNKNRGLCRKFH